MKFSYNWLIEYLKKPPVPEKIAELLMLHAFEVEEVKKVGSDFVLDIKVLPNRAGDCLSHSGIAKEIAAILGVKFLPPQTKIVKDKSKKISGFISVEVEAPDLCPRYSMRMLADVKIGPSPDWLKERLLVCGLRPINNVVDATNYVMLETGQPMHAFDLSKVDGKKNIVRRAKKDEKITSLEGKTYNLSNENLVIADQKRAIGIAGIKGGRGTEIDSRTKDIVIESANFDPINIRKTSKALNLATDASVRFENGLDPNLTSYALERCVYLLHQIAGGKIVSGMIDVYPEKIKPRKISLQFSKVQNILGIKIAERQIISILGRLGLGVRKQKKDFLLVEIPTSRRDLWLQEDLIEETGRLYGYEKIPALAPRSELLAAVKNENLVQEDKIKDILAGLGWSENYNYSLISQTEADLFKFRNLIKVKNPLSEDQKYLRPSLIGGLLKNLKENLKYFSEIRLFELGHIFYEKNNNFFEENKIAAIACGRNLKKGHDDFFELKGAVEILFEKFGLPDIWFDDAVGQKHPWLSFTHPFRRAEIKSGDKILGFIGGLKPEILAVFNIKENPAFFELDFKAFVELASEERMYAPPSKYPAIIRDLSVLVGWDTKIEQVTNIIENIGGPLLRDVDLFDIYEGLAEEKKSLAFRLIYQSDERNLTDEEVNKLQEKIVKAIEEEGWEVRK